MNRTDAMPQLGRTFLGGALLLAMMFVIGCGNDETTFRPDEQTPAQHASQPGTPVKGDWVVVHGLSDPEALNLITTNDNSASEIFSYIYESLTNTDVETLETIPWIADSLPKVSEDKLSYEFTIRKGVKFSDGEPVTAEDFIFYLKTIKNPRILKAAPMRGYFMRVDSAMMIDGDPYRLRVVMAEPYFLGEQWAGGLYAFPKHVWDKDGVSDKISFAELNAGDTLENPLVRLMANIVQDINKNFDPAYVVGSGPYKFIEHRVQDRVVLARNENYWNSGHKYGQAWPDRLVWITINDRNAALSALKAGEIDFVPRLDQVQFKFEKDRFERNDIKPAQYDFPAYSYIGYNGDNPEKPFLSDPKVRVAFAHAVNRKAMIENVYFGNAFEVNSPIYRNRPEYDSSIKGYGFDLEKARTLLEEAGWKDSDGDGIRDKVVNGKKVQMEFSLLLNSGNTARKQMSLLFSNAMRKIGVIVNTASLEWAVFLQRLDEHKFDAYIGGWAMGVQEGDMYQIWHSNSIAAGGSNYVSFANPDVDRLIEAIRGEFDYEKRAEMSREIQSIIHEQQPYNFLVAERLVGGYHKRLQNVTFFAPRPCFNAGWWWTPEDQQRYSTPTSTPALATN